MVGRADHGAGVILAEGKDPVIAFEEVCGEVLEANFEFAGLFGVRLGDRSLDLGLFPIDFQSFVFD